MFGTFSSCSCAISCVEDSTIPSLMGSLSSTGTTLGVNPATNLVRPQPCLLLQQSVSLKGYILGNFGDNKHVS